MVAPAWAILPRRSLTWLTVRPRLWATTITSVVENTWWRVVTSSFFSALSTCSLLQWRRPSSNGKRRWTRSEERRVGKECRCGWSQYQYRKKDRQEVEK